MHTRKISRLLNTEVDVDEHITNISSHELSFFQKLVLCRGLKFAIPQRISNIEIKASFEKAYWDLERHLNSENSKELAAATLKSIALNYINHQGPSPPKQLLAAIKQLKRRDDIVITKPDKGSGVVVMDKSEYIHLLSEASVNDTSKFRPIPSERPKTRGRPPKHYHPLLAKEALVQSIITRILPHAVAQSLRPTGSRLAHLYGLPKTHKEKLAMRPILSATNTYNYALAKWLDNKLKPLSLNQYTVTDIFDFVNELPRDLNITPGDLLVSYDVSSLFTNVPLDETITILADRAFRNNWFNSEYDLNISKQDLIDLLGVATKGQLFQFNGSLYEQVDGVAMGSPLGPLLANVFMSSIEEKLDVDGKLPPYYRRYVDDTFTVMPDLPTARDFLNTLNHAHPAINFTMEVENDGMLPFLGTQLLNRAPRIETKVFVKPTNSGLLLHYHSHVDNRYKRGLLTTMLDRVHRLSSSWSYFTEECERLKSVFSKLKYPKHLVDSTVKTFLNLKVADQPSLRSRSTTENTTRVVIPFKDQESANIVKTQLKDLSVKLQTSVQPVFTSRKIAQEFPTSEPKPQLIDQQCVVYNFKCDQCDAGYVGYTRGHLFVRVDGHRSKTSSVRKHYDSRHAGWIPDDLRNCFSVLKKCHNKFDCLINEMLLIKQLRPCLNVQSDSVRAKVFV